MKLFVSFLQLYLFLVVTSLGAQEIKEYRWKNRLVILAADTKENEHLKKQISNLEADPEGLNIRKIIVISLIPGMQKTGITKSNYQEIQKGNSSFLSTEDPFSFYLIGLDGGIKYRSNTVVENETLFNLIDVMPMRRQEIANP